MLWFQKAEIMERYAGTIPPPPALRESILEWLLPVYRPWQLYRMIISSAQSMSLDMSMRVGQIVIKMIESRSPRDEIIATLIDEMKGIEETVAENGDEFLNTSDGMNISQSYSEIADLLDEIKAIYEIAERENVNVQNTLPAEKSFPLDLTGWPHKDDYDRITRERPQYNDDVAGFSNLIVNVNPENNKTSAALSKDHFPVLFLGRKAVRSPSSMASSLDHELVHVCQYMMNIAMHGFNEDNEIAGWSYGLPPKGFSDHIGQSQKDESEMTEEDRFSHLLDDRELFATITGALPYVRRASQGLSEKQKTRLIKDIMHGGGMPWMGSVRSNLADAAAKALKVEWIHDGNVNKWRLIINYLLKEIS
jgi:hypothetical protein